MAIHLNKPHLKKLIVYLVFIGLTFNLSGQGINLVPPKIVSVSVLPGSNEVEMKWERLVADVDGYEIYEAITADDGKPIVKFGDSDNRTFSFPRVRKEPVSFSIKSYKGLQLSILNRDYHTTVFFQAHFDSCQAKVDLKWTNYYGWGNQLSHYDVYQRVDGVTELKASIKDTTFSLPVIGNKNYLFYVVAQNINGSISSRSNDTLCYTKMPVIPRYIVAERASFLSNNQVSVRFILDPYSTVNNYEVLASDTPDGEFESLRQYTGYSGKGWLSHVDTLTTLPAPKYYKLLAYNNCGLVVGESNIATAMVPTLLVKDGQINILWNNYLNWSSGVDNYVITRSQDGSNSFSFNSESSSYVDDVRPLIGKNMSGYFCYTIKAESNPDFSANPNGSVYTSTSSKICIDLSELIFVPNAFTPNGDDVNDLFLPSFPFSPREYSLVIFNRNGFKVFETKQPLKGWDGKTPAGKMSPEGTYVYLVRFSSQTGKKIEKKGNLSLIY